MEIVMIRKIKLRIKCHKARNCDLTIGDKPQKSNFDFYFL